MSNAQHTHVPAQLDPRRWWALALVYGAFFLVILDAAHRDRRPALDRSRPRLLGAGTAVISAYALTFAGLLLLGGQAAPKLRLVNSQAPSTGANGAPRARPVCGAASR